VKDKHVKDAAQDVVEDVSGDVLGAAEDGSTKVLVVERVIFQLRRVRAAWAPKAKSCATSRV